MPIPEEAHNAVRNAVTGAGPRVRLEYEIAGERRIAIGRRGESADRLRTELVNIYGLVWTAEVQQANDALAEYVATGTNYRPFARALGVRDVEFLAKAASPEEITRAVVLSDRQLSRVWRLHPVYEGVADGATIGDPGEWATDSPSEVVIVDPGAQVELQPARPMAIPLADGRGAENQYFGYRLDGGGGQRWKLRQFEPPLRIALGGALNVALGFGNTARVDEVLPYRGDGFHWDRNHPLAARASLGPDVGPVCRTLRHPVPAGEWYAWLGRPFAVPDTTNWDSWLRRRDVYDRERKSRHREANMRVAYPLIGGHKHSPSSNFDPANVQQDEAA